jgi:hypothetical protein
LTFTSDGLNSKFDTDGYVLLFETKHFEGWDNEAFFQVKSEEPIELHLRELAYSDIFEGKVL